MRGELSQLDTGLSLDQVQDLLGMRLGSEGASIVSLRPWRDVAFPLPLRNPLIARRGCTPQPASPQTVPSTRLRPQTPAACGAPWNDSRPPCILTQHSASEEIPCRSSRSEPPLGRSALRLPSQLAGRSIHY